ncbi:MAG: WG repeat-containing protein [Planctomycetota bacterium]|nr:WG repeat-containing protein [Planctomycetota bacterium]
MLCSAPRPPARFRAIQACARRVALMAMLGLVGGLMPAFSAAEAPRAAPEPPAPDGPAVTLEEAVARYERLYRCKIFFAFDFRHRSPEKRLPLPPGKDAERWDEFFSDFLVLAKPIRVEGCNDLILASFAELIDGLRMKRDGIVSPWPFYRIDLALPLLRWDELQRLPPYEARDRAVCETREFSYQVGERHAVCPKGLYRRLREERWVGMERGGRWGFLRKDGAWGLPPAFEAVRPFFDGRAAARQGGRWGHIDDSGRWRVPARFDEARDFHDGRAAVRAGARWGFVDRNGEPVGRQDYEELGDFSERFAAVKRSGKWGFVDQKGREAIAVNLDAATAFQEDRAGALFQGLWGYLDSKGEWAVWRRFQWGLPFENGRALVKKDDRWGSIDRFGFYENPNPEFEEIEDE